MSRKRSSGAKKPAKTVKNPTVPEGSYPESHPEPPIELSPEEKIAMDVVQSKLKRIKKIRSQVDRRNEARRAAFREFAAPRERKMDALRKKIGAATLEMEQVLNDRKLTAHEVRKEFAAVQERKQDLEWQRRSLYREIREKRAEMQKSLEDYPPDADEGQLFAAFEAKLAITGRLGPLRKIADSKAPATE